MKILIIASLSSAFLVVCCRAQEDRQGGFFTLINTVPNSSGFRVFIASANETNVLTPPPEVTGESAGNGFSTGLVAWQPADGELVAEAPNRRQEKLKPFIEPGETPLVILKAKGSDGLNFSLVPQAADRSTPFYDAINLTQDSQLEIRVDGKPLRLPRGQRVRIGTSKVLKCEVAGSPAELLESFDPPSHLVIFYARDDGRIERMVVADYAL